jgi:hypothetical protein
MTEIPQAFEEFGRVAVRSSLLPVFLGDIRSENPTVENNGTAFIFQPGSSPCLVTAGHVYERATKLEQTSSSGKTGVGTCRMAFSNRLIALDGDLDLATIRLSAEEAQELGTDPVPLGRFGWPPPVPEENELAVLAGYPGTERNQGGDDRVEMGLYTAYLRIASVGSRQIRFTIDNAELDDFLGKGMPPEGYPLGGLSGAPVIVLERGDCLTWRLCGVVTDQQVLFGQDTVLAGRADFILDSGRINFPGN